MFIPLIAPFISPITAFNGDLAISPRAPNIPLKISLTPCQALLQFPVNTPAMKSIIPPNIVLISPTIFLILVATPSKVPRNTLTKNAMKGFNA
ncbi:hypothetical protein D3C81_2082340 [compost metagenome]